MTDLTGQKFNHWTVLELDKERSAIAKRKYWICECDCEDHTIKSIRGDNITSGHSKSCGCYNRQAASERMKIVGKEYASWLRQDLTGQDFGYWHVIERAENQNNHVAWLCQCKCGTKRIVLGQSLKNGQSQSCGCLNISHGELKIKTLLENANIPFEKEYVIQDLYFTSPNNKARFDFFVNNKYAIEFDGEQHYRDLSSRSYFRHNIDTIKEHDQIKNQYCKDHNIPLIRIPYTHLNKLCLKDLQLETSNFII